MKKERNLVKIILINWIKRNLSKHKKKRQQSYIDQVENAKGFRWALGKSDSGNDVLDIEFYTPTSRVEYSVIL